jgi:hypothetical protein
VADHLPLAVHGADLLILGNGQNHLDPGQVGWQLLAPGLDRLVCPPLVAFDVLVDGRGDPLGGVRDVG